MHTKRPRLITARGYYTSAAASSYYKRLTPEFCILLALHGHKKGIQIQVYDISFHGAK
jgi:hypothetical protein